MKLKNTGLSLGCFIAALIFSLSSVHEGNIEVHRHLGV